MPQDQAIKQTCSHYPETPYRSHFLGPLHIWEKCNEYGKGNRIERSEEVCDLKISVRISPVSPQPNENTNNTRQRKSHNKSSAKSGMAVLPNAGNLGSKRRYSCA